MIQVQLLTGMRPGEVVSMRLCDLNMGGEVWTYDGSTCSSVSSPGFGDVRNLGVVQMAEYASSLYAGTYNPSDGCEIWRSAGGPWVRVDPGSGFTDANNSMAQGMAEERENYHNAGKGCESDQNNRPKREKGEEEKDLDGRGHR